MHLMRIDQLVLKSPSLVSLTKTYVDLSETIHDFDESFFSSGGLRTLPAIIAAQVASGATSRFAGERVGAPMRAHTRFLRRDSTTETTPPKPVRRYLENLFSSPSHPTPLSDQMTRYEFRGVRPSWTGRSSLASSSASARAILTRSRMRRIRSPATASSTT